MQTILATLSAATLAFAALAPSAPTTAAAPALRLCEEAYLGVYVVPSDAGGAEVTRLMEGSPAAKAGIQPGDRIVALGRESLQGPDELIAAIDDREAGDEVDVVLFRGDDKRILSLTLGNRAESEAFRTEDLSSGFLYEDVGLPGLASENRLPFVITEELVMPEIAPRITWVPAEGEVELETPRRDELQVRLDEMSARMNARWAELAERLESVRESRDRDSGLGERLEAVRREMEDSRRSQEARLDELREAIRERRGPGVPGVTHGLSWEGPDGVRHDVRSPAPVRVGGVTWTQPLRLPARGRAAMPAEVDVRAPHAASAEEVRWLHDDVRALREEIRELKELLTSGR